MTLLLLRIIKTPGATDSFGSLRRYIFLLRKDKIKPNYIYVELFFGCFPVSLGAFFEFHFRFFSLCAFGFQLRDGYLKRSRKVFFLM